MSATGSLDLFSRVVLLHGLHGSEAVGAALVAAHIKRFLLTICSDLDVHVFGPLSSWSAARAFRFDSDLVDPNRVFAFPRSDYKCPDQLHQFHEIWLHYMPLDECEILNFINACQHENLPLQELISSAQPVYPGLPGFCRSPALARYHSLVDKLAAAIIYGLPTGSAILLVDVHLGIGCHARTMILADSKEVHHPLPHGSFVGEICLRLRARGYSPRALVSETGCLSDLHGLLSLFQELAHRCFSAGDVLVPLRPLVDSTWRHDLDMYLLDDLHEIFSPLFC